MMSLALGLTKHQESVSVSKHSQWGDKINCITAFWGMHANSTYQ